jgi:hypothetical protein
MPDCTGDGFCLKQGDGPNEYEINNCAHKCKPIECPNFKVCGYINPKAILQCHRGTCSNCQIMFSDKLTFYDSVECPICLENKPGVKQVNCDHTACIDCFKRCHYGENIAQPPFPYSEEIEDEYEENHDDPRWVNDPLIKKYNEDFIAYQHALDINHKKEASLRVCGICRK